MELKFYKCDHCGNIITKLHDSGVPVVCCGEEMEEIVPGSVDAAQEKHVPQFEVKDGIVEVNVGSVDHPMEPEHFIEWIVVETDQGHQVKHLKPGEKPRATFALADGENVKNVYEYCNLHGLWKNS